MTKTSFIDFKKVSKDFNTDNGVNQVLKGIDLSIPKGSIYGIIGYSGAGKSTLIRCINGLEKPTSGQVKFDQQVVNELSNSELLKLRGQISMIFQQFNLMPERTIAENVALPIRYDHRFSKQDRNKKVQKLLELVGLPDKAAAYPSALSGGQKQRVAIARALINDPQVLLCDEATSALDPDTTDSILQLLQKLNQEYQITVIVVTHEMHVIETICDQVAVLDHGKIIERGNVYEVFANPQQALTQRFVQSASNIKLPQSLINNLTLDETHQLIHLNYQSGETVKPLISYLSKKFGVDVNIIVGDMKVIQNQLLGDLVVIIEGRSADLKATRDYLSQQSGIRLEVLTNAQ